MARWGIKRFSHFQVQLQEIYFIKKFYIVPILLFVREKNVDANGLTMAYVFLGQAKYISHEGSQPMSIKWLLEEAIPPALFNESRKLAVG